MEHTTYTKDLNYHFSDGNICVVAGQVVFRVHRDPLARQSTVFRDMFDVPPPPDAAESFEGAVVVKLPDALEQVQTLLMFIHGDMSVPFSFKGRQTPLLTSSLTSPLHPTFDTIDLALRISHKYEVARLQAWGIDQFRNYPKTADVSLTIYCHPKCRATKIPSSLPGSST